MEPKEAVLPGRLSGPPCARRPRVARASARRAQLVPGGAAPMGSTPASPGGHRAGGPIGPPQAGDK